MLGQTREGQFGCQGAVHVRPAGDAVRGEGVFNRVSGADVAALGRRRGCSGRGWGLVMPSATERKGGAGRRLLTRRRGVNNVCKCHIHE